MTKPNDPSGTGSVPTDAGGRDRGAGPQAQQTLPGRGHLSRGRLDGIAGCGPNPLNDQITD